MSSKRARCTVEHDGRPQVRVRVEDASGSSSKPPAGANRRRKAPPKEIHVQANGSLPLSAKNLEEALRAHANSEPQPQPQPTDNELPESLSGFEDIFTELLEDTSPLAEDSERLANETNEQKRDAPPMADRCDFCSEVAETLYHCKTCVCLAAICSHCLISGHRFQPTHRIRRWDGCCWVDSDLSSAGLTIYLGHRGKPCDHNSNTSRLLVGDLNGFTEISVRYCTHPNAAPKALQLLVVGLFPCTDERPGSAFTLPHLNIFDALTTVGRTSAYKYYSVLERVSKPGFPADVLDRYREMMSTHRKSLYITKQRRAGHAFKRHPVIDIHPGDQAFDCVACPRPGFNFEWDEVPENERVWFRVFVSYDGNFRSSRKAKKVDSADICLSDGVAYFSDKAKCKEWLNTVPQPKRTEKPVCDHHKAGNDKSVRWAGKEITGVGAFTCTSHSCFIPRGMIDFTRGELFAYCDLAFACMYHYMRKRGDISIGMTYDVWCHWFINFLKSRAHDLPEDLRLPENIDLIGAIPKWHLVGHDCECFVRWALAFIRFVGCLDGEGPERVWAYLNEHSGSTSEQSPGQRTDSINNIAGDWNFEKAINMYKLLVAKFRDAKKMQIREKKNFDSLTKILPTTKITLWEEVKPEARWNSSSKAWESPLMDPVFRGGAQSNFQEERDQEAPTSHIANRRPGVSRCFLEGIELEHSIRTYNDEAKEIGQTPTPKQAKKINSKRMALQS
ncbi:hypothetical protein FRC09_010610 [Ceratobasidium sp. 395]|nr:hypothetical protein FRC09_010610 [Ceratobasidium sp. 395]